MKGACLRTTPTATSAPHGGRSFRGSPSRGPRSTGCEGSLARRPSRRDGTRVGSGSFRDEEGRPRPDSMWCCSGSDPTATRLRFFRAARRSESCGVRSWRSLAPDSRRSSAASRSLLPPYLRPGRWTFWSRGTTRRPRSRVYSGRERPAIPDSPRASSGRPGRPTGSWTGRQPRVYLRPRAARRGADRIAAEAVAAGSDSSQSRIPPRIALRLSPRSARGGSDFILRTLPPPSTT